MTISHQGREHTSYSCKSDHNGRRRTAPASDPYKGLLLEYARSASLSPLCGDSHPRGGRSDPRYPHTALAISQMSSLNRAHDMFGPVFRVTHVNLLSVMICNLC
ncbi:hypothetical protein J6590_052319 [Homalodisca vitripennis]|nr:hypothetical protein J6590_052319 [Homalodisca vitripennis]